ncbi:LysR family transcriptional regulator [Thalassotalea sp. ND16A]|uniref:LysR family transcriptional regulator n=1 Tax=Thalassotalea sp. ND16A TaxID=1535422 RepID=UPI00051A73BB|nr:LysR family transcriptional regulator [Thalassotalea sp. ND16A]KGJ97963.1 hypothetical protein ND16A_0768 [Thalassotalea sp. ND16A]
MGKLENMRLFVRVIEAGSITKAAEQLNLAKSAVSKRLADLEEELGSKLINRTTRTSSLTEAGANYYQRSLLIIDEVDELDANTKDSGRELAGNLKLSVPLSFGLAHLNTALDEFAKLHPDLTMEIDFSDRHVDIVDEGFDLAFRIGDLKNSSLQARKITRINHVLCASPDYLKANNAIVDHTDLPGHSILKYKNQPFTIFDEHGKSHSILSSSKISANNGDFLTQLAISGHGIALEPTFIVWQALKAKQLTLVLSNYSIAPMHAYAVYPPNRYLPIKTRTLIDFLVARFGDNPYWDKY